MDITELNRQFTPSIWSKRFAESFNVVQNHIQVTTEESFKNALRFNVKRNISYGIREMETMDIYFKDKENETPIIVYIHGGYWQELTKNESAYCVKPLADKGCRVIILDYGLCPKTALKDIVDEIQTALGAILQYGHETETKSVTIIGHSAGAHLIMSALEDCCLNTPHIELLKSIFLISGVYDLRNLHKTTINQFNILGLDEKNEITLSPILKGFKHLKPLDIKFYIFVAENDTPTFIKQSFELHHLLTRFDLKSTITIIKNCDHFDIVENLRKEDWEITQQVLKSVNKI